jgi:hypothetical protein
MGQVYGDSTPFPYGADFIETIRHAVECGVAILLAQHDISDALDHTGGVEEQRRAERARLDAFSDAVRLTVNAYMSTSSERLVRAGTEILHGAHAAIEREVAALDGHATDLMSGTRQTIGAAREQVFRAVEGFILAHDLPNTEIGLRLFAAEERYEGQALVATPFGIEAIFDLAIPIAHQWGRPRRVADLTAGTAVHVPKTAGWLSKRLELSQEKLDRLFLSEVTVSPERTVMWLRKGPRSGTGYQVEVNSEGAPRATLRHVTEEGSIGPEEPLELSGEDQVHVTRLWNRVLDSTRDLETRRQSMTEATFDGRQLRELDEPRAICERMVMVLTPIVQEISARSGAPGELVLRRDAGEGRRDEVYITKAELQERVMLVHPTLRSLFDGFGLEGPRSPRAPMPSEPIRLDLGPDDPTNVDRRRHGS